MRWTTCYNETHQAKEAEREALRRAEQARLDSIRIVEEKARREAEEKAKRYNPTFKEGDVSEWIAKNMQYPRVAAENGISGRVNVGFVVECDGSISHVQVLRGVDPSLDKEAVRLVRSMPKWNPGMQNGEPIRMEYNVPVQFKLR